MDESGISISNSQPNPSAECLRAQGLDAQERVMQPSVHVRVELDYRWLSFLHPKYWF